MRAVVSRIVAALTVAAAASAGVVVAAAPAHAACAVMTLEFDPSSGGVVLSPDKLAVDPGSCVTLHNATITSAQFTVGAAYKQTAAAFSDASPDYVAGPAGTSAPVTATSAAGSAHGTIVVNPAPAPSGSGGGTTSTAPSPRSSPATPAKPARHNSQPNRPRPASRHAVASSAGPVFPVPSASAPPVTPLVSPAPGTSPFLAGQPSPTASPRRAAVIAGPLQPPTGRGTGLPAALAALAVVGTAGALLRVLLAEPVGPVDDGRTVGAAV